MDAKKKAISDEDFIRLRSIPGPSMALERCDLLEERERLGVLTEAERDELFDFRHGYKAQR